MPDSRSPADGWRTIEIETTEVTEPDVAITPDGEVLIFTLLGKLFRLPAEGGEAEQLTFGPYYDSDIALSPDGRKVAFVSDRDGSEGNVFVLDLANGQIVQATHEAWVAGPTWTPDGRALVYLRLNRERWPWGELTFGLWSRPPAQIGHVRLDSGVHTTLRAAWADIRSVFYLPDGRLGWTVVEPDTTVPHESVLNALDATSRIEVMAGDGTVSTLRILDGVAELVVASPNGDGLYFQRPRLADPLGRYQYIAFAPLTSGRALPVAEATGWYRRESFGVQPRFAITPDGTALYQGLHGRLRKVRLPGGERYSIPFRARVTLEVRERDMPSRWTTPLAGEPTQPRSVRYARLSPDGQRLVFTAARYLWEQPLDGGPVRRISEPGVVDWEPVFSPAGNKVAFLRSRLGAARELCVFDVATGQTRVVSVGVPGRAPIWTPEGTALILVNTFEPGAFTLVAIDINDGSADTLAELKGAFMDQPAASLSADGRWLDFAGTHVLDDTPTPTLFRLSLRDRTAQPELVGQLALPFRRAKVSPDGSWFVFRPRLSREIRAVPMDDRAVTAERSVLVSAEGNADFAFTADGSRVVYTTDNRVWQQTLNGGQREEIPVRLALRRSVPPPLLIRHVRPLDFSLGEFGREASLLIEAGRIRSIRIDENPELPPGAVTLDAEGRFAIPGLFDMHTHQCGSRTFVPFGVTSVRNMGVESVAATSADADRGTHTNEPVPRCFDAGHPLRSANPHERDAWGVRVLDQDDTRAQVETLANAGVRFIKLYTDMPWPLQRVAAAEARRLGLPVAAHGWTVEQLVKGVTNGYGALTHLKIYYDDVLGLLAATGTPFDPTLAWTAWRTDELLRREPERLDDPRLNAFATDRAIDYWRRNALCRRVPCEESGFARTMAEAHRLGVELLTGTDSPGPAGWTLQLELKYFSDAGIPPLDILRYATYAAAEAVGAAEELGTLEVGKLADIVLLDANPLEDIENTQTIWRVIKGGWVFDPEQLRPDRP